MNLHMASAFIIYFIIIFAIAFIAYRKNKRSGDFLLANRSLNYWVTALAAHASDMSGWLFMAFPAAVYTQGLVEGWTAISLTLFMYFNWRFIAPKIRTMSEAYQASTISSFFECHFKDKSGVLRLISALFCLYFFTFYISANLVTLGKLFESAFNMHYAWGISIGSLVVFYVLLGGFLSISWIDFFQGLFLLGVIIMVPLVALFNLNDATSILSIAAKKNIDLSLLSLFKKEHFASIVSSAIWGIGYFGQPHIITKFMGIKNVSEIKKAQTIGISWQIITLGAALSIGIIGIAFFPQGINNPEFIFIEMVQRLFSPFFVGLILCAIFATAINVMGAQVLVAASVITEDFYKKFLPKSNDRQLILISRISVLIICFFALLLALFNHHASLYNLVLYAWAGLGCTFGPLLLTSLHTRSTSRWGALACIICGGTIATLWPMLETTMPTMLVGFIGSFIGLFIGSLIEKRKQSVL